MCRGTGCVCQFSARRSIFSAAFLANGCQIQRFFEPCVVGGKQGLIVIVIAIVDSAIALLPIVYSACTLCIQCVLDNGLCFASHFCTTAHDLCLVLPNYGRTVCVWVSQSPWQLRSWAAPQLLASLPFTGPHWLSLSLTGFHWACCVSLCLIGSHWISLARNGPHWPSLG